MDHAEALKHLRTLINVASETDELDEIYRILRVMSGVVDNALPSVSPPKTRAAPVKKRVDANCSVCGALVDMRDLTQVMAHLHGVEPLDLTGKPDP